MRFHNRHYRHYCGIDLHVKTMYVCILDAAGQVLIHRNLPSTPQAFLVGPRPPDRPGGVLHAVARHGVLAGEAYGRVAGSRVDQPHASVEPSGPSSCRSRRTRALTSASRLSIVSHGSRCLSTDEIEHARLGPVEVPCDEPAKDPRSRRETVKVGMIGEERP